MTLIVIYFFPPVSCDWKLTWFVLLAKSQRAVLSKPFTCFSLLEKCKQRAPVSASVWHHLPAVFLKSFFLQVCSYKREERENLLFLPFFVVLMALKSNLSKGNKRWGSSTSDCQELQNVACATIPMAVWVGCALSPTPGPLACLLLLLVSLPGRCWPTRVTSSLVLLLCFPCASQNCHFPPQIAVPLLGFHLCMLLILLEGGYIFDKGRGSLW